MDVPLEKAPAAARVCGSSAAFAVTLMPPLDSRCEPLRTEASVSNLLTTLMATDPAMLVEPLPPAAAAPPSTNALLVALTTFTDTAAPMLVLLSIARAAPTPLAVASSSACAEISTALCAVTSAPWVTLAVLSDASTLTDTAAATPTPLLLLPPLDELELLPLLALSFADGSAVLLPLLVLLLSLT